MVNRDEEGPSISVGFQLVQQHSRENRSTIDHNGKTGEILIVYFFDHKVVKHPDDFILHIN